MPKRQSQRTHAKRRASERFGLALNRRDLRELVRKIQNGEAAIEARQSLRITVWHLAFRGVGVRVVYDSKRHEIVTFLPIGDPGVVARFFTEEELRHPEGGQP